MAILTDQQLVAILRATAASLSGVHYTRPVGYLAIQAVEDWFEANRAALITAINTATAPIVIPNPEKAVLIRHWLAQKFERGG